MKGSASDARLRDKQVSVSNGEGGKGGAGVHPTINTNLHRITRGMRRSFAKYAAQECDEKNGEGINQTTTL